jgi:hypothetical protein
LDQFDKFREVVLNVVDVKADHGIVSLWLQQLCLSLSTTMKKLSKENFKRLREAIDFLFFERLAAKPVEARASISLKRRSYPPPQPIPQPIAQRHPATPSRPNLTPLRQQNPTQRR